MKKSNAMVNPSMAQIEEAQKVLNAEQLKEVEGLIFEEE